jgi:hypothetical protein
LNLDTLHNIFFLGAGLPDHFVSISYTYPAERTSAMSQSHEQEIAALQQRLAELETNLATATAQRNTIAQFAEDAGLDIGVWPRCSLLLCH